MPSAANEAPSFIDCRASELPRLCTWPRLPIISQAAKVRGGCILLLLLASVSLLTVSCQAQLATAQVTGRITDPSGAAVPNAQVGFAKLGERDFVPNGKIAEVAQPTEHVAGVKIDRGVFWRKGAIAPGFQHVNVLPTITNKALQFLRDHHHNRGHRLLKR